ncbi:DUF4267 domain-containing protein [Sphingomonas mucosissima]|uniref:DUF4267 domain-containing protein n=1 Tax=Sphingomonas mucosissima TaxID=370959 RepID=A0A245ZDT8_9SPHN|nr:DUF4267 domain-containing protein [Sphingomonas mucosissima]OWK27873.1 hypothetical protein SPMU_33060 [Sphingomonas mucosissima]
MSERPPVGKALAMTITLLACVFAGLGVLFVLAPVPAASFYGIDPESSSGLFYVRAVGFRDLGLASYLFGLTLAQQFRALSIVMLSTLIIPAGDILLLAASDGAQPIHYLLHAASFLCFAGSGLWARRSASAR